MSRSRGRKAGACGITFLHKVTGLAHDTIARAQEQLRTERGISRNPERQRRSGGGRKSLSETDERLIESLKRILEENTRGDPMKPLLWTDKSTRSLAEELNAQGHKVSHATVGKLLEQLDYNLQSNQKSNERKTHPDRNAQFEFINQEVKSFQERGSPVISADAKKKELIGDFKNPGQNWRPKGDPLQVQVHDFEYKDLGKGIPYGVYDMSSNRNWVIVGTDHETAEFAVETISRWWKNRGPKLYPKAKELLITTDEGGSNGKGVKLWKFELSKFAKQSGLKIHVSHLPPGTSKWNRIEHRRFSQISRNGKGRPLLSHQVMVNLIENTTTKTGLKIRSEIDNSLYELGIKINKIEMGGIKMISNEFHGD